MAGGVIAWLAGKNNPVISRYVSLLSVCIDLLLVLSAYLRGYDQQSTWITEFTGNWIPAFGIQLHLALDGLSLLLLILTYFIGILAVLISWREISYKTGFFHFNIMWILAGITGVFLSLDLFLFYFFWEVMLIPMYFLIGIWGHENRIYASFKFFIFTQASGLLMFIAIIALYLIHGRNTGLYTFDYHELIGTSMTPKAEMLIMGGFLAAFLVKLPVVPFHSWLPDAHTEAPTAGSLILASLMLKTGAYGLLRFVIPLFPHASEVFAPAGMILGVAGILYGAILAFAQTDLKRLVAYTSVNHMGFIVLGVFAFNEMAYQGVVMQMIAHGISTGALFIISGQLYERMHTRDIRQMGGLWEQLPAMGAIGLVFVMASLGLPGLGNFIAEFLTLTGVFRVHVLIACLASIGLVFATLYSIRIMQRVFYGNRHSGKSMKDLSVRELITLGAMVIVIIYLGFFPQRVINTARPAIMKTLNGGTQIFDKNSRPGDYVLSDEHFHSSETTKLKNNAR
jgi:NADH-quinone oxidoreductase subunit M